MLGRRGQDLRHMTLRRQSSLGPWAQFGIRVAAMLFLLAFIIGFHWIERESLRDNLDGHVSFSDIIYFTMISATTTGYGDIVPVTDQARLFDALIVTPIRVFFILILAGTAYTFVIKRVWSKWLMQRIQNALRDHVVVVGYGVSGTEAVKELIARGTDLRGIVVIDCDEAALQDAEELGCAVLKADATRDKVLQAVRIEQAKALIVSAGSDDTSILVTLTARHIAPKLKITVKVRNTDNELLARQAGATTVVNPVSFAGLLLAGSAEGPVVHDYIADLASMSGRVQLVEREVRDSELGKSLGDLEPGLGVRIVRDGLPVGFWEEGARMLCPGDIIVEIVPTCFREADKHPDVIPAGRPT
ncbi:potassium channel family protein [Sphingosinicella sp. YJ22]|uniref:potassium channel family protein n=1 Tax=Sphingosinicella sp. YJ22 TaxID=1104780 RepID=UPI00140AC64F|nr:potassium channel family protein [Sphingosinicella sp. YJ22]